jgi:uncharacterized protein (DUF4415 family)
MQTDFEYGVPDEENPEWTAAMFKEARPAREVLSALFGVAATDAFLAENRRSIGQRGKQKAPVKEKVTVRLDADILDGFRATGKGWQTRMNDVLRAHPPV